MFSKLMFSKEELKNVLKSTSRVFWQLRLLGFKNSTDGQS